MSKDSFIQKIEHKAHELFKERGSEHGHDWEDWFEAERQMEGQMDTVDKDCIRSQSLYEAVHRSLVMPASVDIQK